MFCENCGKKLIRGYQFCVECGTPVPPEESEQDEQQDTAVQQSEEMPGIQPLGSDEGTLVYCPTCGMRMQKSTDHCEKCGMKLADSSSNGGVPLVNTDPLGGDFSGISDNDIAQIDNFVNNSGFDGSGISYDTGYQDPSAGMIGGGSLNSEIEALNQQFANLNSTASDMPAISAPVRQPEPEPEPVPAAPELEPFARRVDNFSMEAGMPETQFLSESGLPVVNGGEMTEPDIPVELEHHLDDINIEVAAAAPQPEYTAPAYTEPVAEAPVYTEPVAEEPVYTEPVAEAPVYTEPVAEEPVYTEPVAEMPTYTEPVAEMPTYTEPVAEAPVYTEPVAEEPVYTEPVAEAPVYTEPVAEAPVYTEPVAEMPTYTEPVAEAPVYTEPVAEMPTYTEPVAEAPVYTEPVAEMPTYTEPVAEMPTYTEPVAEAPVYSEPVAEMPTYTEPVAEMPTYTEPVAEMPTYTEPVAEMPTYTEPVAEMPAYTAPVPPAAPANVDTDGGVDLGKLIYCRNCGQDMYEKETVCKNCGSPNKWNEKPMRHPVSNASAKDKKQPFKLFGVIPIPTLIGGGVVVAGIIALIVFTTTGGDKDTSSMINSGSNKPSTSTSSDTSSDSSTPEESNNASVPDNNPVDPVVPASTESDPNAVTEPEDTSAPDNSSSPEDTSAPDESTAPDDTSAPDTTTPENTTASTKPTGSSSSSSASVTTPKTTTTSTTAAEPAYTKPSATVVSEDKQRAKIMDAFEAISAEVGKLTLYCEANDAAVNAGKSRTYYTSGMKKTLSSGKSNAASLFKSAEPTSSTLSGAYKSLEKMYNAYVSYYDYVINGTDLSNAYSKLDSFISAVNGFSYSKLITTNQTASDKSRTYAELMTNASTAGTNAVTQFTNVQGTVEKISKNFADTVFDKIYNDKTTNILKAAGYVQVVHSYYLLLGSDVASAKTALSGLDSDLDRLLSVYLTAGDNSLSGFKNSCNTETKAANNHIWTINNAIK